MRKDWFPTFSPRPILQIEQAVKAKTKKINYILLVSGQRVQSYRPTAVIWS